jgi:hypothetical protein
VDDLRDDDYRRLLELRTGLRRFERWSRQQAAEAGLTSAHHQLLLAIRGHPGPQGPTITEVAEYLQVQHHSVVGLIDRAVDAGLCQRSADSDDARVIRDGVVDEHVEVHVLDGPGELPDEAEEELETLIESDKLDKTRPRGRNVGRAEARLVFHLGPLAPSPELGHVDTEETQGAEGAGEHERPVGAAS